MDGGFQSHTVMRELTLHRELSAQAAWELCCRGLCCRVEQPFSARYCFPERIIACFSFPPGTSSTEGTVILLVLQ